MKIPNLSQLQTVTNFLFNLINIISARCDISVTASTDSDADYAAEVIDARVDAWANENPSLGANIRDGQIRQTLLLKELGESQQEQINALAEARLENLVTGAEAHEKIREKISLNEEFRIESNEILQGQINMLSNAVLNIALQISDIREILRNKEI